MWSHFQYSVLVIVASASMATALPTAEVEVLKSEEVAIPKGAAVHTLEDSEEKPLVLTGLRDEGTVGELLGPQDDRGKRMLDYVQTVLQNILQPKPIVDTITEEEKYGNNGDTLGAVGRGIVGGSEAISNFINLAIEYPRNMFKSLVHRATEALNHLGSKLVGL